MCLKRAGLNIFSHSNCINFIHAEVFLSCYRINQNYLNKICIILIQSTLLTHVNIQCYCPSSSANVLQRETGILSITEHCAFHLFFVKSCL